MKRFKALLASALLCMAALMLNAVTAFAGTATATIGVDSTQTTVGQSITINVSITNDAKPISGGYTVLVNGTEIGRVDFEPMAIDENTNLGLSTTYVTSTEGNYVITLGPVTASDGVPMAMFEDTSVSQITYSPVTVVTTAAAPTTETPTTAAPETTTAAPETTTVAPETTTAAPQLIAIKATYNGPAAKVVGEVVTAAEVGVVAVFDNGLEVPITDWTSDYINVPLVAGTHNLIVNYGPLSATFTVNVITADASQAAESAEAESSANESSAEETSEEETSADETSDEETSEDNSNKYITVVSPFGGDNLYMAVNWDSSAVTTVDGFTEGSMEYSGYTVKTLTNDVVTLVYMTDETGANGDFYIYDADAQKFSYYIAIPADEVGYYILAFPDDFDDTGLSKMTISLDAESGKTVTAYHLAKEKEESGTVCLVYAMDTEGNKGYYRFDSETLSFVRYFADAADEEEATADAEETTSVEGADNSDAQAKYTALAEKYNKDILMRFYVIIVLIVLAVILFIFVIVLAVKLKKLYSEYDFIDDEGDGEKSEDLDEETEDAEVSEETETEAQPEDEDFRVDLSSIEEAGDDESEDDE